ncbi:MAG: amino acid ABC transporter permease [Collinsella sp.]
MTVRLRTSAINIQAMVCLSIIGCSSNVYSGHDADAWPGFLGQFAVVCADAVGVDSAGNSRGVYAHSKIAPLRWIARIYISVMRGTPLMLQMFAIYFAPYYVFGISLTPDSKWTACVVAFIINYAGYFAEIYRSGLQSIPRGQYEAAEVLGYSRVQTFLYIVMPQVAKRILPAMGNEIITLVKDTSLAFAIGVGEMFSTAKALVASQVSMVPFAIAALIYWVFNFVVEMLLGAAEKQLDYYHD